MNRLTMMLVCFFLLLISCGKDEVFFEEDAQTPPPTEQPTDNNGGENEEEEPTTPAPGEPVGDVSQTPCDFTLDNVQANTTIAISCKLDLAGKTINLPSNVNFDFEGGQIINGTLKFSGGQIDGRLLNFTLGIEGSAQLKDPTFFFDPDRWDVVQGSTNYDQALKNRYALERIINLTKKLGATTFQIDELDAYFEITKVTSTSNLNYYPSVEAINVPSDFHLMMTDNTKLRVYPNDQKEYSLLAVRDESNVRITGGVLIGDRDQHDYSSGGSHEWGHLLDLHAAVNTRVTGVKMTMASGDGMKIHSLRHTFEPEYKPANAIVVTDCVYDNNRRNNLSITDGYNITIENNTFLNASNDTPYSEGVAPGYGIDVEAYRRRGDDGELIFYEIAKDIHIRNNTEKNSRAGAITVAIGYDVTIEGNRTEKGISYSTATGTRIIGNTVEATTQTAREDGIGIKAGRSSSTTIDNNKVIGNTVIGYSIGIYVTNDDVEVYDNVVEDFETGIYPVLLSNARIYKNQLTSSRASSRGIFGFSTDIQNVIFEENTIDVQGNPYRFVAVNEGLSVTTQTIIVRNNDLYTPSKTHFNKAHGITFSQNNLNHGIEVFSSSKLMFSENVIKVSNDPGIHLREANSDIQISSNGIDVDADEECIEIQSTTSLSEVVLSNNQCVQ